MNINFKLDKDEEKVIVSNERGVMESREYQDNINAILILEDVIEEQTMNLAKKQKEKEECEQEINDIDSKIKDKQQGLKWSKRNCSILLFGAPIFSCFLFIFKNWMLGIEFRLISSNFIVALGIGCIIGMAFSIGDLCNIRVYLSNIKQLENKKIEVEKLAHNLDLEIHLLEEIIKNNKEELQKMLEEKVKNNIENMPLDIQNVSYHEELERQREYLKQMYEANKSLVPEPIIEPIEPKGTILGRFRKKKI